jgi:hypothetical protein
MIPDNRSILHHLAPAGGVVLIPGVALKCVTPKVSQNHLLCFGAIMTYTVLVHDKNKQTLFH